METRDEILNKLREIKPVLRKEFAVKKIGIFGSFTNSSFTAESDIDILVQLDKPIGWKYFSLEKYLESIFKRKIDLVTREALKKQIRNSILQQVKYV